MCSFKQVVYKRIPSLELGSRAEILSPAGSFDFIILPRVKSGWGALPTEAFIMKHLKRCSGTILIGDSSPGLMKAPPAAS